MSTDRFLPPDTGRREAWPFEARMKLYPLAKGVHPKGDSIEELTGLSRDTLEAEIRAGRLLPTRVRGRVMVRAENLEAWIYRCEELPESTEQPATGSDRQAGRARNLVEFRLIRDRVLAGVKAGAL